MKNQIIKSLIHPCISHICYLKSLLEECTNVVGGTIIQLDILARGNIDMGTDGVRECLGDTVIWLAGNDQLELLQILLLSVALKRMQESLVILLP